MSAGVIDSGKNMDQGRQKKEIALHHRDVGLSFSDGVNVTVPVRPTLHCFAASSGTDTAT